MNDIPLSLYVHFPWCVRKCPYCDFNSHEIDVIPEQAYLDRLIEDLISAAAIESRHQLTSVFFGGGTPSLFSAESIARLINAIQDHFDISSAEVTMEANPGTFDQANFAGYFDAGINRLSIGAQSFSEQALKALGRIHNTHDIHSAVNGLQQVGFKRFNLDIMHGLPGQSHAAALDDLDAAINLGATHISWYQLTIEPNTVFYNRPPALPDENILMNIAEKGASFLSRAGFEQYEISAWSKPGHQARHNLNYWKFGDYIGIGAGAHGKLTRLEGIYRTTRTRLPKDYLARGRTSEKQVPNEELLLEYLMNTLRLTAGFTFDEFTRYTGFPTRRLDHFIERATGQGLIVANEKGLRPTNRGQQFLNNLLMLVD